MGNYKDENGNASGRFYSDQDGSSHPYRDVSPKKEEQEEEEERKKMIRRRKSMYGTCPVVHTCTCICVQKAE